MLEEEATRMSSRVDSLAAAQDNPGRQPDTDLQDLKQQLQYLRNELKSQSQVKFIYHQIHLDKCPAMHIEILFLPGGYKTFSMPNSTDHEISIAHKR